MTAHFKECKSVILDPKRFWDGKVPPYNPSAENILWVLVPLILLSGLAAFLGEVFNRKEFLWSYAILHALRELVCYGLQFTVAVPVLSALLVKYKGTDNKLTVGTVVAYSMVPALFASILINLFPGLYAVNIVCLYGFYIYATGVSRLFGLPEVFRSRYIILSILLIILAFGLINTVTWKLFEAFFTYGT